MITKLMRTLAALAGFGLLCSLLVATPAYADPPAGKLLLVLDSSGSMAEPAGDGKRKIDNAKSALRQVVGGLDPAAQVGMRVYGATVFDKSEPGACTDSKLVVPIAGNTGSRLKAAIEKYEPYGETPIAYSLEQAGKDVGTSGQRTILLVSDGEETCDVDPCDIAQKLAAQGIDLKIDVIGLGVSGKARTQLKCIADKGRGTYTDANDLDDLQKRLGEAKTRALRPFQVTGTPVEGTAEPTGAPQIGTGRWRDELPGRGKTVYYTIPHTTPGSTVWAGISAQGKLASSAAGASLVEVKLTTAGGAACNSAFAIALGGEGVTRNLLTGSVGSRGPTADEGCATEELLLAVSPAADNEASLSGVDMQIDVYEQPPVQSTSGLPAPAGSPTWTKISVGSTTRVTPGTSFADAPELRADRGYAFDVVPSEIQLFRVAATWGQRIEVLTELGSVPAGATGSVLDIGLIGPNGGQAADALAKGLPAPPRLIAVAGAKGALATREIRYRDTENPAQVGGSAALPGDYFVALSYPKQGGSSAKLPVRLRAAVLGKAGNGAPTYNEPPAPSPEPSSQPSSQPNSQPTSQPSTEPSGSPSADPSTAPSTSAGAPAAAGGGPGPLVIGLIAAAVVLAAVGTGAVVALRRSAKTGPSA